MSVAASLVDNPCMIGAPADTFKKRYIRKWNM